MDGIKNRLGVRYVDKTPLLRYMVAFSFGQNGKSYNEAKNQILESGKWSCLTRGELVPQEEDLYEHLYYGLVDTNAGTNIGCGFKPVDSVNRRMHYVFYNSKEERKKFSFSIVDEGIFIFRTGIGIYWYEVDVNKQNKLKEDEVGQLTPDELEVFQNRFKELNVLRIGNKKNWYRFYDNHSDENNTFTMGNTIAKMLKNLLGEVYFFPPRVNELLRTNELVKTTREWKEFCARYNEEGSDITNEEYQRKQKQYDLEKKKWEKLSIEQAREMEAKQKELWIVPDRATLFNYVVFNAEKDAVTSDEKKALIAQMCEHVYHLTRGYKFSYRVSEGGEYERQNMLYRHENDVWDASLEGAGCYVLIYDNLYDKKGNLKSNSFYDHVRPIEMQGDYFILYILLLYQHYSLIYIQQRISNQIPIQTERFLTYDEETEALYDEMHRLKVEIDTFLANSVYGAVSHISDVCTIYSFIEKKMMIRENIENMKQGFVNVENLQNALLKEKTEAEEEKKATHLDSAINMVALFAIISVYLDAFQLVEWIRNCVGDSFCRWLPDGLEQWMYTHSEGIFNVIVFLATAVITGFVAYVLKHIRQYRKLRKEKS